MLTTLDVMNHLNALAALPVSVLTEALQDVTRPVRNIRNGSVTTRLCDRSAARERVRVLAVRLLEAVDRA